jgi:glyoxylase-like metal-dependent hydrolase (beta-lactamase superfamily II)
MSTPLDSVQWIHGANCAPDGDPPLQIHRFDADTVILRQSKCFSFEAPFIYLFFGEREAILFDTGAAPDPGSTVKILPIRKAIDDIVASWLTERGLSAIDLIVTHTHGHRDHRHWDDEFRNRPGTRIVTGLARLKDFFGLPNWPNGQATRDLGGRDLIVLPLPGHEESHIAVHDRRTGVLLTGDTLYPGKLTVDDWAEYRASAARLAAFAVQHPISLVLGNHIELNRQGELFPIGTRFQPNEHALPLSAAHIREWHAACEAMADAPHRDVHRDFIIDPG